MAESPALGNPSGQGSFVAARHWQGVCQAVTHTHRNSLHLLVVFPGLCVLSILEQECVSLFVCGKAQEWICICGKEHRNPISPTFWQQIVLPQAVPTFKRIFACFAFFTNVVCHCRHLLVGIKEWQRCTFPPQLNKKSQFQLGFAANNLTNRIRRAMQGFVSKRRTILDFNKKRTLKMFSKMGVKVI